MKFLLFIILLLIDCFVFAHSKIDSISNESIHKTKGINIYIISKYEYFDFTNRIIVWQAKLAALFHEKKLKIILATSTKDAEKKITALIDKHHYTIDNLWFDSHGKYRKGYSSFMIGNDEYDYKDIADTTCSSQLKKIASYCTPKTKIGIGACYAAADYQFPVIKNGTYNYMHGDSLLEGMGNIFRGSTVYACKSWVMAKPWIFGSKNALAGYPLDRQYKDTIFSPVWKDMGEWESYSSASHLIKDVNTIYLSHSGNILIQDEPYLDQKKAQRKLSRNLKRLRPALYDLKG